MEEFTKLRNFDTLDQGVDKDKFRQELNQMLVKRVGTRTFVAKSKNGKKVKAEVEYHVFDYKGGTYSANKILKFEFM